MSEIVITGAARTAIGKFGGGFAALPAHRLGATAISAALARSRVAPEEIREVILGQVLTAGEGQNPARQAAVLAGVPVEATAFGINQMCGSGLRAVALAAESLRAGGEGILVAGGQENMTLAPHLAHLRSPARLGSVEFIDSMLHDGLTDAFHGGHMGLHTDRLAAERGISRKQQDAYALRSQQRTAAALAAGRFQEEIVPVRLESRNGGVRIDRDEYPRPEITAEALARLKPAFVDGGSITAGTASGINDGAAALVLMHGREAQRRGLEPLARIVSWATAGVAPRRFGLGPVPASGRALELAGWKAADLDLVEANEAYAAQALAVTADLGLDPEIVNGNGGAIALGHPIGASGARVLVTLLYEMQRRNARRGLATLCIGGGMGVAMCVERWVG